MNTTKVESYMLKISVVGGTIFSLLGIIWGIFINSQMILFDGLYSFVSVILSSMSLIALNYIKKGDFPRFPFGKEIIEPIVVVFKSLAIISMCLYAFSVSLVDIFAGGREIQASYAILYALFSTVLCIMLYLYLNRKSKVLKSEFVKAESVQWLMDSLLSFIVLIGFSLSYFLQQTSYSYVTPYIDPVLVLIISIYLVKYPLQILVANGRELLLMSPPTEMTETIKDAIHSMEKKYEINETYLRIAKVGRKIIIEIDFVLNKDSKINNVADLDSIREELNQSLQHLNYTKWLSVSFTNDKKWVI